MNWKIVAVVFLVVCFVETTYIVGTVISYNLQVDKSNECYYDICGDYPDAFYEESICTCYDYDVFGDYIIAEEKYMR